MADRAFRRPHDTPALRAWRRFAAHWATVHAVGVLAVLLLAGLGEPWMNGRYRNDPLLGALGAAPESLGFALLAGGTGAVAGLAWAGLGVFAGGAGGRLMIRSARWLAALPLVLVPVLAGGLWGRDAGALALATAASVAPAVAVAGHEALRAVARRASLTAAEAAGLPPARVALHHHLPALAGPLLLAAWPALPAALLAESLASLLGFGMPAGLVTWGTLLGVAASGTAALGPAVLAPAAVLAVALAALHAVGNGLGRALGEEGR